MQSSSVSPVHKPVALSRLLLFPLTSSPSCALGGSTRWCKASRVGEVRLTLFPQWYGTTSLRAQSSFTDH